MFVPERGKLAWMTLRFWDNLAKKLGPTTVDAPFNVPPKIKWPRTHCFAHQLAGKLISVHTNGVENAGAWTTS